MFDFGSGACCASTVTFGGSSFVRCRLGPSTCFCKKEMREIVRISYADPGVGGGNKIMMEKPTALSCLVFLCPSLAWACGPDSFRAQKNLTSSGFSSFSYCREEGIRTLETVSRLHTFQACSFNHSDTSL